MYLADLAKAVNLDAVGVVPVMPTPTWDVYRDWVAQGYAGDMAYLARPDALARRADPRRILPEAKSVLVVAATYGAGRRPPRGPLHGEVCRYAWGDEDYHHWLLQRLEALVQRLAAELGPFPYRCYVDTGPVLERAWAWATGLGWIGKNTNLIHPTLGSYVFLGVALLGVELEPFQYVSNLPSCGTCSRCMEACPTQAIVAPRVIDARRCLAYVSIEHRGSISESLRSFMGARVFGCDICQEVCPWNQKHLEGLPVPAPAHAMLDLPPLLYMSDAQFRARFWHTSIWRATPEGLARNAAIVLGNLAEPAARVALEQAAQYHSSAIVREHAAWALAQLK